MRPSVAILLLFVVISPANGVKSPSLKAPPSSKLCDKTPVNNCNCHCNLHQDPRVGEALKALETKMEELIALVNRTSTPQPSPVAGKPILTEL